LKPIQSKGVTEIIVSVKRGAPDLTNAACLARGDLRPAFSSDIVTGMKFHKIWVHQCRATRRIKKQFGVKSALDYLLGEKLLNFAEAADQRPEFAAELPRFQAEVWNVFNPYELAGYLTTLKPSRRKKLKMLLDVNRSSSSRLAT
jgi:hypothetical protein